MSRAQLTSTVEQSSGGVVAPFLAGKNKIINGDFSIWQRGTSFTVTSGNTYTADRWTEGWDGTIGAQTISQVAFDYSSSPASDKLPISGYQSSYFLRWNITSAGSGSTYRVLETRVEDAHTLANQTVTLSFWGKADSTRTISSAVFQRPVGSSQVYAGGGTFSVGTTWQRYSATFTMPSLVGATFSAGHYVEVQFVVPNNTALTFDIWGVQFEAGLVATPFTTASGTLQGELALCQRYYQRFTAANTNQSLAIGNAYTTSNTQYTILLPVPLRTSPTAMDYSGLNTNDGNTSFTLSSVSLNVYGPQSVNFIATPSGSVTQFRLYFLGLATTGSSYIGFSAEL